MAILQQTGKIKPPDEHFRELMETVSLYDGEACHLEVVKKAYEVASIAHEGQIRASGEPYIIHPIEAAKILAGIKMDHHTIAAALLHDVVEDTKLEYDNIKEKFGKTIADLVDGVTKLTAISDLKHKGDAGLMEKSKLESQAENLRKIFLAMAKDIRVIMIKVADRLHNLKTLGALAEHKQKSIASETLEIYAPITSRLGMWEFKWQLEDLAFQYLEPEKYYDLAKKIARKRKEREELIEKVKRDIGESFRSMGLSNVYIEGRPKHLYGIYQKMLRKNLTLDEIYDISAIRIIVDTVRECYQILGIVHNLWMPIQNRFKDYIAMPKPNNYRSLHTTIYGPGNQAVEIQIRTWEMHRVNEYGIAAHWAYKEEGRKTDINMMSEVYPWIRRILDWQNESRDARDYIENLKLDLLKDEVFVFTPKGDVIDLPAGSTPLDFAYRIHTEVGHRYTGAKVNSKIVTIDYKLQNADIVEILTSKHGTPSRDWLNIVQNPHAKNKIRQWFKKERREENISRGRDMVHAELKRNKIDVSLNNVEIFSKVATRYNFLSIDDLFASVGYGETSPITVCNRVKDLIPVKEPEKIAAPSAEEIKRKEKKNRRSKSPILIKGMGNLMVKFARCCSPVWGDPVVGFVTLGKGVSVHRVDCPNYSFLAENKERIVQVEWVANMSQSVFTVELEIDAWDRQGLLSEIMNVTNELKYHVHSAKAWAKGDTAIIKINVDIPSKEDLEVLTRTLKKIKDVTRVFRVTHRRMK